MKRILILGPSGSGKSTLCERLGKKLNLPIIHLDRYYWNPGWQETPPDEWTQKIRDLISGDCWVMDGNYKSTLAMRSRAADSIIFIDMPRRTSYLRVFLRFLKFRGRPRPDLTEGCPEKIDRDFLEWIWYYPMTHRPVILGLLRKLESTKSVIILKGQNEIERFVSSLDTE
ncbi:MAG: AAA family ATPase [Candidatus Thorarchaeota archaeon]